MQVDNLTQAFKLGQINASGKTALAKVLIVNNTLAKANYNKMKFFPNAKTMGYKNLTSNSL